MKLCGGAWVIAVAAGSWVGCSSQRAGTSVEAPTVDDPASCVDAEQDPSSESGGLGHLEPEAIRSTIRSHHPGFTGCYELGVGRHPGLRGRVTMRFAIGIEGKITMLRVAENDLVDCSTVQCLRDEMARIEFPPPEGGTVTVEYPIALEPAPASPSPPATTVD